jgi:hypothetical protein
LKQADQQITNTRKSVLNSISGLKMPTLIGIKREGGISVRIGKNGILIREQPYHATIIADSKFQDRTEIIYDTPGMPSFGQVYQTGLTVKSINADPDPEDPLRWHVVITTSTEVEEDQESRNQSTGNTSDNPIDWIPIASCKFEPYEEVMREDLDGKKWVNSAKKPFETGLVITRRIAVVPFSQFEPISTSLDTIMDRCDTVNSDPYRTKAAHKLLLTVEDATIGTYSGVRCWRVDYTLRYKKDDWRVKQLDVGWGYYDTGDYKPFLDSENNPFMGNLDGTGAAVPDQENDDPETLYFKGFETLDFNSFLKVLFT